MLYIILFIILLIIIIIKLCRKKTIEGYDKWDLKMFNGNWNKKWMGQGHTDNLQNSYQVGYNNPYPQEIPRQSNNDPNFPQYILEIVKEGYLDEVLQKMINKDKEINGTKLVNLSWDNYFQINKNTWYNRLYGQNKNQMYESCIPQTNKVLKYFIKNFNNIFSKSSNEKYVRNFYGYHPFYIFKYKVHYMKIKKMDKNCAMKYGFIVVILREESYVGITLFIEIVTYKDDINLIYYDLIGYYTMDKLYLPEGIREVGKNKFYELNPLYRISKKKKTLNEYVNDKNWAYLDVNYYNVDELLWKNKQYKFDNTLKRQHTCFNAEPQYYNSDIELKSQPILDYVYNKYNCESKYDQYGRRKPKGLWDQPCSNNNECIFYQKNKNYPNIFGFCNKEYGFCQLPKGMKNLGYHYYYQYNNKNNKQNQNYPVCDVNRGGNYAPLCYNCKNTNTTNIWKPNTNLGTCCDEQNNKKLYPHLDGPDYAYDGDINARINYYNEKNII
jgi:hypothetical protein